MDPQSDKQPELVAPAETMPVVSDSSGPRSSRMLRFLIVYIPLEFILVLALAAAVQA